MQCPGEGQTCKEWPPAAAFSGLQQFCSDLPPSRLLLLVLRQFQNVAGAVGKCLQLTAVRQLDRRQPGKVSVPIHRDVRPLILPHSGRTSAPRWPQTVQSIRGWSSPKVTSSGQQSASSSAWWWQRSLPQKTKTWRRPRRRMVQSGVGFGGRRRLERVQGIAEGYCTPYAAAIGQRLQVGTTTCVQTWVAIRMRLFPESNQCMESDAPSGSLLPPPRL